MIKLERNLETCPVILSTNGLAEQNSLRILYNNNPTHFISILSSDLFKSSVYASATVKSALKTIQNNKCCFCESYVSHVDYGDVEHYRPKAGWIQDRNSTQLNKPGYFLEAYNWENLMFSCAICNQREKKNYYPLINQDVRITIDDTYDIRREDPLFLNPYIDNPEDHIEFVNEIPRPKNSSEKGRISIEYLALDRNELNEVRREKLQDLQPLLDVINLQLHSQADINIAKDIFRRRITENVSDNRQFVSMIKSNFSDYI